jgi:hypothetical protein
MSLESQYEQIQRNFAELTDFSEKELDKSRALFNLETVPVAPREFEVWTCLVGLPLSDRLTYAFQDIATRVASLLPPTTRFYRVIPHNYHWELFIIKRPHEEVSVDRLEQTTELLKEILSERETFTISYRGFLVTTDGTVIVKGYGDFEDLRKQLRERIEFASPQQSKIGHVSLGRILDPIGRDNFVRLKQLVDRSQNEFYGDLKVSEAKYVHETQWYMENRKVIARLPFKD